MKTIKIKITILAVVAMLVGGISFAGNNPKTSFVINDVTLFNGEEIINTSVLVEDGKISKIQKDIDADSDYKKINGAGKFLMPAMTNSHVHIWHKSQLDKAVKAGVLNVLSMLSQPNSIYLKKYRTSPKFARAYFAGYAATAPGGHGTQYSPDDDPAPTIKNVAEIEPFVKDRIKAGSDYIKIIVEPWKNTLSHALVEEIIKETHRHNKMAVVHISREKDAYKVIENGADGIVHLWGNQMSKQKLKSLVKKHDFFIVPTLLLLIRTPHTLKKYGKEDTENWYMAEVKKVYDAGVTLLAGTDPPNYKINYGTDLYEELIYFSRAGIPNIEVLKTATSNPAQEFEVLKNTGYIKEGYNADMILLNKSPIDNMENIKTINTIWKEGVSVKR